jgi:starch synthase
LHYWLHYMEIIHVSAECYPVAKAGGLGDVVGALPKYINQAGHVAKVVMPMYRTPYLSKHNWKVVHRGYTNLGAYWFNYNVLRQHGNKLGFELYLIDVPGLLDRPGIYGYDDDNQRFMAFQIATLNWINNWQYLPDVIHCHDHHAALIPFMVQHCYGYRRLARIPTVLTIHNAQYQGWMGWDQSTLIPEWDTWKGGLLEWNGNINRLAAGIKCAWKVTTVSHSYMQELQQQANGLESLFQYEQGKCLGILNGIDTDVWSPVTDPYVKAQYDVSNNESGKAANKRYICETFHLDESKPLVVFIGRLVGEKAADVLPDALRSALQWQNGNVNFMVLGNGEPGVEAGLRNLLPQYAGNYNCFIGYDEALSHVMYAGADFLLMPSRVEPCGLNQMYAMKYGTVPMVRDTGGLRDTVQDMGEWGGWGIKFAQATVPEIVHAVNRAVEVYADKIHLGWMRQHMMYIDHSWQYAVQQYIDMYRTLQ